MVSVYKSRKTPENLQVDWNYWKMYEQQWDTLSVLIIRISKKMQGVQV